MRILHVNINYLFTALHQNMIEHLTDIGVENLVFVPVYDERNSRILPNANVVVSRCFRKWDRIFYYLKQRKIQKSLVRSVAVSDYGLIHAYTLFSAGNTAMQISAKYGIPYIVAVRGTDLNDFFHLKPYLISRGIKIMKNAEAVIFLSRSYQEIMFRKYVPKRVRTELEKKAVIIPNGIDDFWMKNIYDARDYAAIERRFAQKELSVICVAQISKGKNIPFLLRALEKIRERGWKTELHVIGNAADKGELKIIEQDKYTVYHGSKKKEELIKYYRANDIFILASHTESFGLVYGEAMSQGLPVIYTAGEGFDQQFEEGHVGFSTSDRQEEDLAEKILKTVADYRRISENCLREVKKFDWNQIVRGYKEMYGRIIDDKGAE